MAFKVTDRRGMNKVSTSPTCRVCGAPEEHTRDYNNPTMLCIGYLRREAAKLEAEAKDPVVAVDRFRLVQDNDSHWFLVPAETPDSEWDLAVRGAEEDGVLPGWARSIDGPHRLTFTDPVEG